MNRDKKFFYIANWKSYFTYHQSLAWLQDYDDELGVLTKENTIILCPDFLTLAELRSKNATITFGAQTCSSYGLGAYTGEISAQSLSELGIIYCIVGHSERRRLFYETLDESARKIGMLFRNAITPILCVSDDYKTELNHIFSNMIIDFSAHQCIIAYEPISSIGTGFVPSSEKIATTLDLIKQEIIRFFPENSFLLVYGGSVSSLTIQELKTIKLLDGFLIGKASTDFQELKKIVEYK